MDEINNVTVRRARAHSNSDNLDETFVYHTLDGTVCSMPDISDDENIDLITHLKKNIDDLTIKLSSANGEIDSLSIEIEKLKKENEILIRKNSLYKQIAASPLKSSTTTPKKQGIKRSKQAGCINKQTQTDSDIVAKKKVSIKSATSAQAPKSEQNTTTTSKVCILSNNTENKILSISNTTLQLKSDICHYLMPHCTMDQMMLNIETKVKSFTMNDFCIIMIGEEDINSNNYPNLIFSIRASINKIQHTNIIICAPTYKCGNYTNIFNGKIEYFNSLLCHDIFTHEHAYFLDSNMNLTYDYKMFYRRSGKLNNTGMRTIFQDLNEILLDIKRFYADSIESNNMTQVNENNQTRQCDDQEESIMAGNQEKLTDFFRDQ